MNVRHCLLERDAKLPAEFVRQPVANSQRAIPFRRLSAAKARTFFTASSVRRAPRALLLENTADVGQTTALPVRSNSCTPSSSSKSRICRLTDRCET